MRRPSGCSLTSSIVSLTLSTFAARLYWVPLGCDIEVGVLMDAPRGKASAGGLEDGLLSGASDHSNIDCGAGRYGRGTPGRAIAMHPSESKNVATVRPYFPL